MNKYRGVCHIDIGGKKRGLVFNMNTYAIFCEGMDIMLSEMDEVFNSSKQAKAFSWLIYAGLVAYCEKEKIEQDFDIHDLYDWVMDVDQDNADIVMRTMHGSREMKNKSNNGLNRDVVEDVKEDSKKN